eukprot:3563676-Rhodomonas_salina.1
MAQWDKVTLHIAKMRRIAALLAAAAAAACVLALVSTGKQAHRSALLSHKLSLPPSSSLLREVPSSSDGVSSFLSSLLSSLQHGKTASPDPSLTAVQYKMLKLSHLASVSPSDAKTIAASLSQLPVPPQALLDYDSAFIPPYVDDLDAYLDNVITEVDKTEIPDLNEERASPSSLTGKRRATILSSNFLESQGVFTGEQASDDQKVKAGGRESPRARNPSMYLDEKRVPVHLVPDNAPLRPPPSPLD